MEISQLKHEAFEIGIRDVYNYIRNFYLKKQDFPTARITKDKKTALEQLVSKVAAAIGVTKENLWENPAFHIAFRITTIDELASLGDIGIDYEKLKKSLEAGEQMGILPLNVLHGNDTIKKFIPQVPNLVSGKKANRLDPYGIFRDQDQIICLEEITEEEAKKLRPAQIVIRDGKKHKSKYLGSRKFDYAVLLNITEYCDVRCAYCYKRPLTGVDLETLSKTSPKYAELKKQLASEEQRVLEQTKHLTQWLNKHKEVDTVIISGGEPLTYSAETLEKILDQLGTVTHLKTVRICTSAVYQGLFYKITDTFVQKLSEFEKKNNGRNGRTKKQLYINAHVTDEKQLLAPEAIIASEKLTNKGISIHLQMPLQEGINFYRNDVEKSAEKLTKICKASYTIDATPYKSIIDMHSPGFSELTVPIEKVSEVIACLDEHFANSDMERWQAFNVLHEQGNSYVYPKPHFAAVKEINNDRGRVTYFIPKCMPDGRNIIHTYEEPLLKGINDNPNSLSKIRDAAITSKIAEVQNAYHRLLNDEISTKRFYEISGIKMAKNEPLIIGEEK